MSDLPTEGLQSLSFTGLRFDAALGILAHEKGAPQPIQVDAELSLGPQPLHPQDDDIHHVLDYRSIDADNHYYEAEDAFTRHLDPKHGQRVIEWCQIGKRKFPVIAGKVSRDVTNPTFDPVSPAGAMAEYFRGNASGKSPMEYLGRPEPIRPEYRDRDARLAYQANE